MAAIQRIKKTFQLMMVFMMFSFHVKHRSRILCSYALGFDFSLIKEIGIDESYQSGCNQGRKKEPERRHSTEERPDERQRAGDHKQHRTESMCLIPNSVA